MTMTCREVLVAARALIADPKHWAKHSFALNKRGKPVSATSHSATCFCALGAVQNVLNSKDRDIYQKVRSSLNDIEKEKEA